uniref:Uncharacterized protein n=1 Tax=Timema douglasi TaxID=61478 RepID=A0A7R8VR44_TIMDO|nr:unnamed protein product [Timema douglasi]
MDLWMCLFIFGGGDEMEREPRMVETTLPGEQTIAYDFSPCVVSGTVLYIPKDSASRLLIDLEKLASLNTHMSALCTFHAMDGEAPRRIDMDAVVKASRFIASNSPQTSGSEFSTASVGLWGLKTGGGVRTAAAPFQAPTASRRWDGTELASASLFLRAGASTYVAKLAAGATWSLRPASSPYGSK